MTSRCRRSGINRALAILFSVTALSAAPASQTFTGTITDEMCGRDGHASMRMGPTDAACTKACVAEHDASYVLATATEVYALSDQKMPERLAGRKVRVVGTLDSKTKTIHVTSMSAAK